MPTTTAIHGLRVPVGGDRVQVPVDMLALAQDVDKALPVVSDAEPDTPVKGTLWVDANKYWDGSEWQSLRSVVLVQGDGQQHPASAATTTPVSVYGPDDSSVFVGDMGYQGGVITVARNGVYRWHGTVEYIAGLSASLKQVLVFALINGVGVKPGEVQTDYTPDHARISSAGSLLKLGAGDTVQMATFFIGAGGFYYAHSFGLELAALTS